MRGQLAGKPEPLKCVYAISPRQQPQLSTCVCSAVCATTATCHQEARPISSGQDCTEVGKSCSSGKERRAKRGHVRETNEREDGTRAGQEDTLQSASQLVGSVKLQSRATAVPHRAVSLHRNNCRSAPAARAGGGRTRADGDCGLSDDNAAVLSVICALPATSPQTIALTRDIHSPALPDMHHDATAREALPWPDLGSTRS